MECSHCKYAHTHVVYTRNDNERQIRRRRECLRCSMRFTTFEQLRDLAKDQEYHKEIGR